MTPQWRHGPCFPMFLPAPHLPAGEEERSKGKSQQNKYAKTKVETRSSPISSAKERGEINQELILCMNLVKPGEDSWGSNQERIPGGNSTAHGVLKNQLLLGRLLSPFLFVFLLFCIRSFREGR